MERVRKIHFDPLLTTQAKIRQRLETLPVGSAHPFSPKRILLCKTQDGTIEEIDISGYPEDYFYNAVDLGEMGEILLRRMANFQGHLSVFNDFQIMQAPASTFRIPIVTNNITILAVSTLEPTYYDFCFADAECNTCCWTARETFPGIHHSGDIVVQRDLLDYVRIKQDTLTNKEIGVFISGYQKTAITRFLGTHPALLVADHVERILYIIPVPLDAATIGNATICCPLVFKRDGDSIIFSILSKATTDTDMMCSTARLVSPAFKEAIARADFTITAPTPAAVSQVTETEVVVNQDTAVGENTITSYESAVFMTNATTMPTHLAMQNFQVVKFGTALEFDSAGGAASKAMEDSPVTVLPCIFGAELEGPMLLATGACPSDVPFTSANALRDYYKQLKSVVVVVNDRMTDNARNLASAYRINAVFVVQPQAAESQPKDAKDVIPFLNTVNINAVTALAGPQSLVLVQMEDRFYFYRGIANRKHLNTAVLEFGADVTSVVESAGLAPLFEPAARRIYDLGDSSNTVLLPASGQFVLPKALPQLFAAASAAQVQGMEEDISAAVSQLQMLLSEKDLLDLSHSLVEALVAKVANATEKPRRAYMEFLTAGQDRNDPAWMKQRARLHGELKTASREAQLALEPAISKLSAMMSLRTTSKRTHDLKRLERQTKIKGNVEAVKEMTFEKLAEYLETYASDMGVMVLNIQTRAFTDLLGRLAGREYDAGSACELDSRILYLDGLDAGIIMEQSQGSHSGPLRNQSGPMVPIMAMPYLNQGAGTGSMLAWVCWDEFVNLTTPFDTRWMEKCNDAHIAALRIIMRSTLSNAVVSREHSISPGSPEAGQLMGALLMASMAKLAATRQTAPVETEKAEDTVTKLMRGLFGNLLTVAGSGVRPMSMVWQLFGKESLFDVPSTRDEWLWYENIVSLYPYTEWPLEQFHNNLQNLLDKAIVRVVTKGEDVKAGKQSKTAEMARFCRLKNIQLDHCRTIITVLKRMLTEDVDKAACASRLLACLPETLERQTESYSRLIRYLEHISTGGERRSADDATAANVYTRRSAAFSALKAQVAQACGSQDWTAIKDRCAALKTFHTQTAEQWQMQPAALKMQSMGLYDALRRAEEPNEDMDQQTRTKVLGLTRQALGDAELERVPWQVGKVGQYGPVIEPLDEAFVAEMLTGERTETTAVEAPGSSSPDVHEPSPTAVAEVGALDAYKSSLAPAFVSSMEQQMTAEHVCTMLKIPVETLRVFAKALNPEFAWENLGDRFRAVVLGLLANRSGRIESRPVRKLFDLTNK